MKTGSTLLTFDNRLARAGRRSRSEWKRCKKTASTRAAGCTIEDGQEAKKESLGKLDDVPYGFNRKRLSILR